MPNTQNTPNQKNQNQQNRNPQADKARKEGPKVNADRQAQNQSDRQRSGY